jgi:hypothetical protein
MSWIRASEKLPQEGDMVLGLYICRSLRPLWLENGKWCGIPGYLNGPPLYWLPLPEIPWDKKQETK